MPFEIIDGFQVNAGKPIDGRTVKRTLSERDAIPALQRYPGMACYVLAEGKEYRLVVGIENNCWREQGRKPAPAAEKPAAELADDDALVVVQADGKEYRIRARELFDFIGGLPVSVENAADGQALCYDAESGKIALRSLPTPEAPVAKHNALQELQGGAPDEYYHFSAADFALLQEVIHPYQPPALSISPQRLGTLEVGDGFSGTRTFQIGCENLENVKEGKVLIDGAPHPLPQLDFQKAISVTKHDAGKLVVLTCRITDVRDEPSELTAFLEYRYRAYLFLHDAADDLLQQSGAAITEKLRALGAGQSELRTGRKTGVQTFSTGSQDRHLYTACPVAFGQQRFDNPTFPNNFFSIEKKDFEYANGGARTAYRLTRLADSLGLDSTLKVNLK